MRFNARTGLISSCIIILLFLFVGFCNISSDVKINMLDGVLWREQGSPRRDLDSTTSHPEVVQGVTPLSSVRTCSAEERQKWISHMCAKNNWTDFQLRATRAHKFIIVDDVHKVMYCSIPKVAGSTIKTLLHASARNMKLADFLAMVDSGFNLHNADSIIQSGLAYLNDYTETEKATRLETYHKFMVVRHPFDRLLSAYTDKVHNRTKKLPPFHHPLTLEQYPEDWNGSFQGDLSDFLRLVSLGHSSWFQNAHWRHFSTQCNPCEVKYDAVVKMETMAHDMPDLLRRIPGPDGKPYVLPSMNQKRSMTAEEKLLDTKKTIQDLKRLFPELISRLFDAYEKDFQVFGYGMDLDSGVASCRYRRDLGGDVDLPECC